MATGTVKWFNAQKGYGFIQPDDGTKDVFVHISAVERSGMGNLREGQKLNYELERGQQGKTSAVNLRAGPLHDRAPASRGGQHPAIPYQKQDRRARTGRPRNPTGTANRLAPSGI